MKVLKYILFIIVSALPFSTAYADAPPTNFTPFRCDLVKDLNSSESLHVFSFDLAGRSEVEETQKFVIPEGNGKISGLTVSILVKIDHKNPNLGGAGIYVNNGKVFSAYVQLDLKEPFVNIKIDGLALMCGTFLK